MRVLGIDPGLGVTGYGVIDCDPARPAAITLVEAGAIRSNAEQPLAERLREIHAEVTGVLRDFTPDLVGLEDMFSTYRFPRSALLMAHARAVVCLAAAEAGVAVADIAPASVKVAVSGSGRASKSQVQAAVARLLDRDALPGPADVADALAVAIAVAHRHGRPDPRQLLAQAGRR